MFKTVIVYFAICTALLVFQLTIHTRPVNAQTDTDIYLFDIEQTENGLKIVNGRNITERKGYDNQPFFHPEKPIIFFSSFNEQGRSDIKQFDFEKNITSNFTTTNEREYSPTVTPDGKFISCIVQRDNEAQDLCKYALEGGDETVLVDDLTIGYHAWMNDHQLILFVLGPTMDLYRRDLKSGESSVLAKNIGRALHKIPGERAMSFVQKAPAVEGESEEPEVWTIKRLDIATQTVSDISETLPGREDLAWFSSDTILMSDGEKLFAKKVGESADEKTDWQPCEMGDTQLKGITRIAVSPNRQHLAVVVEE